MDVFISWTTPDREVKNLLAEKLDQADIKCWVSDEFCVSNFAEECVSAIRQCSVFIALVSDAAMTTSTYMQNEIELARNLERDGKLNILVYKITDQEYTDKFTLLLNHVSFVSGNLVNRKLGNAEESGLDIIVKRTQTLLKKRKEGNPEKPYAVNLPQISGLKVARTGYFVEHSRDEELGNIEAAFDRSNVVILTELFGFGKRSTIKKYIETHARSYASAVIVPNEYGNLRDFFTMGLEFSNLNDKIFADLEGQDLLEAKFQQLEKLDHRHLLVVPDVQFRSLPDVELCERLTALQCHIVLITQDAVNAYEDWFPVVSIGKMREEHLLELFFHHYTRAYEDEQEALIPPLQKFFADIGGHTKTVELTAASLGRDIGVAPEDVPGYLSMRGTEGMQLKDRILHQIENVFNVDTLTEEEITALVVAAYVAVPYISENNYREILELCGVDDWSVVMDLDKRRWLDVDIQNRTVSMEKLVAHIVLTKFPDAYLEAARCLDSLYDNYMQVVSVAVSVTPQVQIINKLEHLFSITDLPEFAQLMQQMARYLIEGQNYDSSKMEEALHSFEKQYETATVEDAALTEETEEPEFDEDWEAADEKYTREDYAQLAYQYIKQSFIPLAKVVSKGLSGLMTDYSAGANRVVAAGYDGQLLGAYDPEELLGVSREEMQQLVELMQERKRSQMQIDPDDVEEWFFAEYLVFINAFYNRDMPTVMLSMQALLALIRDNPHIAAAPDSADILCAVIRLVVLMYQNSGVNASARMLCEEALSYPFEPQQKIGLLQTYIAVLQCGGVYTEELYNAYEEILRNYDKTAKGVLDSRQDLLKEKQALLLVYAEALAKGERIDEAHKRFAELWKLDRMAAPDDLAECANTLVEATVRSGDFPKAVDFIRQYFTPEVAQAYRNVGNEDTCRILDGFVLYLDCGDLAANDFDDASDPCRYVDYYQTFARENNSAAERKYYTVADKAMEFDFSSLTAEEITEHAQQLRKRARMESIFRLAPEAFALASEAGMRVLGYRHHYVQYVGAAAMADGKIAEILNGEGKTYTVVLTAFLRSLYQETVFVVDASDYLTHRNYHWMRGIYDLLGVPNLHVHANGEVPALGKAVVYVDVKTLMFGYLHLERDISSKRQDLSTDSIIIDEIDVTLVDQANDPYSVVSTQNDMKALPWHRLAWDLAQKVVLDETYYTYAKKTVSFKPEIYPLIEETFQISYSDIARAEDIREIEKILRTAIICCGHYQKDQDYFIQLGAPVQENDRGMFEPFNASYTYFLCLENGLNARAAEEQLTKRSHVLNRICVRDFLKKFKFVCGTTATAVSFRKEFREIYNLDYVPVPPHKPSVRRDYQSPMYLTMRSKDMAILDQVEQRHAEGQPLLLVSQSVEESEKYSRLLRRRGIDHKLLNARNASDAEAMMAWAGVPGSILVTNALAGRGADIKLGGNPELKTRRELINLGEDVSKLDEFLYSVPTPEQEASLLYKKYYALLEKNRILCAADRQTVVNAGGLCVIGTSFFPELRTEQQARGRSGRQGEIGESWVFRSVEDESMKMYFDSARVNWLITQYGDVECVNVKILNHTIDYAQKAIHDAYFAGIRSVNQCSAYMEQARSHFVGLRFDLREGLLTTDDLLESWAKDKRVLTELQKLQKGEARCGIACLNRLWETYPQLRQAKGGRASKVLLEVIQMDLDEKFIGREDSRDEICISVVCKRLLDSWEKYINLVLETVYQVSMKKQTLDRYLDAEMQRLLTSPVEALIDIQIKK